MKMHYLLRYHRGDWGCANLRYAIEKHPECHWVPVPRRRLLRVYKEVRDLHGHGYVGSIVAARMLSEVDKRKGFKQR